MNSYVFLVRGVCKTFLSVCFAHYCLVGHIVRFLQQKFPRCVHVCFAPQIVFSWKIKGITSFPISNQVNLTITELNFSCSMCTASFLLQEYFKCPYDEKCKMDVSNRRFCKRCRLRKCFEIGMRKEYILTEEEKARKRQKIEENR